MVTSNIASLIFVDDVVLLALSLSLERSAAKCEAAGMRISSSNPILDAWLDIYCMKNADTAKN